MSTTVLEWSHLQYVADLTEKLTVQLSANEAECAALAKRLEILGVNALSATVTITPEFAGTRYQVTGNLHASVIQTCIRTAKPVTSEVLGEVEGFYADKEGTLSFARAKKKRAEDEGDQPNFVDESEDPEALENGAIELGELVAQSLALAINPYPVSPDAPNPIGDEAGEKVRVDNPFAILSQLRDFVGEDK